MTPFAAPVPMRASGLVRPLSIAGGLPGPGRRQQRPGLGSRAAQRSATADDLLGAVPFDLHRASTGQFWPVGKLS